MVAVGGGWRLRGGCERPVQLCCGEPGLLQWSGAAQLCDSAFWRIPVPQQTLLLTPVSCCAALQSIVSCNQLVRNLAPLLADVAQLSVQAAANCQAQQGERQLGDPACAAAAAGVCRELIGQQECNVRQQTLDLVRQRLTVSLAHSLLVHPAPALSVQVQGGACSGAAERSAALQRLLAQQGPAARQEGAHGGATAAAPAAGEQAGSPLAFHEVLPGRTLSLRWSPAAHQAGVLLLVSGARPCRDFSVVAATSIGGGAEAAGGATELAAAAQPLPPLAPGVLEHVGGPGRDR